MCQATEKQTEIEKADRGRLVGGGKGEMAGRKGQRDRRELVRERGIEVYDKVRERSEIGERERKKEMYRYIAGVRKKRRDGHVSRNLLIPHTGA